MVEIKKNMHCSKCNCVYNPYSLTKEAGGNRRGKGKMMLFLPCELHSSNIAQRINKCGCSGKLAYSSSGSDPGARATEAQRRSRVMVISVFHCVLHF